MTRRLFLAALVALVAYAVIASLLVAQASAWAVSGGTSEQREYIRQMVADSELDLTWLDAQYASGLRIRIEPSWEGYWDFDDENLVSFDPYPGAAGLFYSYGLIVIKASYPPGPNSFFGEVVGHELSHADWFRLPSTARQEWLTLVGGDPYAWYQSPLEHYAEQARLIYWDPATYHKYDNPRTQLRRLSNAEMWAWRTRFAPFAIGATTTTLASPPTTLPPSTTTTVDTGSTLVFPGSTTTIATTTTTTTTLPPTTTTVSQTTTTLPATTTTTLATTTTTLPYNPIPAFKDIDTRDRELNAALHWARANGYVRGYVDGTFRPYNSLLKRHAAFIMGSAGYAFYPDWLWDYSVATRGEVRPLIEGWLEDRGGEPLLRSQLVRLLWRAR